MAVTVTPPEISSGTVTLAANTVDTVTFDDNVSEVEVHGVDANAFGVYFTVDGSTPTIDGKRCHYLDPGNGQSLLVSVRRFASDGDTVVKLLSAGAAKVRVTDADAD